MHRFYLAISLLFFCLGNAGMIIAFQTRVPKGIPTPEWIFDILSIGLSLFNTAPLLLILGLAYKFKNWILSACRIPASLGAFVTIFNMIKEVSGINDDYSTAQLIVFLIGATLTFTISYGKHREHIGQ